VVSPALLSSGRVNITKPPQQPATLSPRKATAQPAFSFLKGNQMKSASAFVRALEQGLSPIEALQSLPEYEPRYIHKIPVELYRAALRNGWRFFPVSFDKHHNVTHANLVQATDDVERLRLWARESPNWALVRGRHSGVFVLEVDGDKGLASLLDLCGDD
jgi:Bifunctional DNA primase/polymerase, N-terminal